MSSNPARARFFAILALRWIGAVIAVLGMLALNGRALPHAAGYLLFPLGLVAAFVAPGLLARRWRTREP